jgi:hypothetical protein
MSDTKAVPEEFRSRIQAAQAEASKHITELGRMQMLHDAKKDDLVQRIRKAEETAVTMARAAAVSLGIDPDGARMRFNWVTLEFTLPAAPTEFDPAQVVVD